MRSEALSEALGRRLSTAVVLFHGAVADRLGLNLTDYKCLELLARGACSPGQLASASGLSSASTTLVLDRLEQKGFVRRTPDPRDRRRTILEVVMPGGAAERFQAATAGMRRRIQALMETFSDAELAAVSRYLEEATGILENEFARLMSGASSS
jgi:DNA-binding MarR family transcriptional regulator